MQLDAALRKFQAYFRLPGEAQKMERVMEVSWSLGGAWGRGRVRTGDGYLRLARDREVWCALSYDDRGGRGLRLD